MKFTASRAFMVMIAAVAGFTGATNVYAKSPTLEKIRSSTTLTLGYREASIPFSYLGTGQKPVGFSLDLCAAVAEKTKAELKLPNLKVAYVPVNASNRIPLLQNGTIDIECGGTTNTLDRQKQVAFSVAIFVSQPRWLTTTSSGIDDPNKLRGKTVVVTQGSLNLPVAEKINTDNKLGLTITQAKDHSESILMLRTGRASAFFEDNIILAGLVATSPDPKAYTYLPNLGGLSRLDYFGLMLPKDDQEFKAFVDGVLKEKMASGEFTKIYEKWFTSPIPPNNQNLGLPMSEALKARVAAPSDTVSP
ncbi:amino acid ABC transporter substrate-binding protein [Herbaspirillum sp. GCM10030257]|uniref:amino acid ABC transporter substrate-binding protein n=1 Tax=Herbaspirillum sp. GCM10030257 TaxID=3273393 RepID=UPI003620E665